MAHTLNDNVQLNNIVFIDLMDIYIPSIPTQLTKQLTSDQFIYIVNTCKDNKPYKIIKNINNCEEKYYNIHILNDDANSYTYKCNTTIETAEDENNIESNEIDKLCYENHNNDKNEPFCKMISNNNTNINITNTITSIPSNNKLVILCIEYKEHMLIKESLYFYDRNNMQTYLCACYNYHHHTYEFNVKSVKNINMLNSVIPNVSISNKSISNISVSNMSVSNMSVSNIQDINK